MKTIFCDNEYGMARLWKGFVLKISFKNHNCPLLPKSAISFCVAKVVIYFVWTYRHNQPETFFCLRSNLINPILIKKLYSSYVTSYNFVTLRLFVKGYSSSSFQLSSRRLPIKLIGNQIRYLLFTHPAYANRRYFPLTSVVYCIRI